MSIREFLAELQSSQIRFSIDGDRLRCSAPVGALTPELRQRVHQRKSEILQFLQTAESVAQMPAAIVPLQPRGDRMPVFAVAGHNGDVFAYRALAAQLGSDQPFFGLRPPGLNGHSDPMTRVEDLAKYFADQIEVFRPGGPIALAGYCAGGTVAFDLARQLEQRGRTVAFLAMIGCPYITYFRYRTVHRAIAHARRTGLAGVYQVLKKRVTATLSGDAAAADEISVTRARVERATLTAARQYQPRPFSVRLKLILPGRTWAQSVSRPLRWRSMAPASEVYFRSEECERDDMLLPPYVKATAELFIQARDRGGEAR